MGLEEREMSSNGRLSRFQRVGGVRGRDRNLTLTDAFTHCASCGGIGAQGGGGRKQYRLFTMFKVVVMVLNPMTSKIRV